MQDLCHQQYLEIDACVRHRRGKCPGGAPKSNFVQSFTRVFLRECVCARVYVSRSMHAFGIEEENALGELQNRTSCSLSPECFCGCVCVCVCVCLRLLTEGSSAHGVNLDACIPEQASVRQHTWRDKGT